MIRRCARLSLLLLLGGPASAAASSREPLRETAAAIVKGFDGHWQSHFKIRETAFTRASDRTVQIVNRCRLDGSVAICDQSVDGGPTATLRYQPRTSHDVEVSSIDADGHSVLTSMEVRGDEWIFPWAQTSGAQSLQYRVVNRFKSPDLILWSEDARPAGGRWRRVGQGLEQRVGQ